MAALHRCLLSPLGCHGTYYKSANVDTLIKTCGQFYLSRRRQGTNFVVWNPSAHIRDKRLTDPTFMDGMTREVLRPRLSESIVPTYMLPPKDCPAWPYKEKGYRWYHRFWDGTLKRFDENTRLIVVEGNFGTECGKFSKELAERLGFHHIRQPQIEDVLVDSYGIDKRDYFHLLPEKFCYFDTEMFFAAPDHPMVVTRLWLMFYMKFEAYLNAMAHMLNTGQGVVVERNVFTDVAFVFGLHKRGFISDAYASLYPRMRAECLQQIKHKPHLFIYLDCPPSQCMENVKKRGRPWEVKSKLFDYDYVCAVEEELKTQVKRATQDSAVIIMDWKTPADMDSVLDEIYKIDFTFDYNISSERFQAWNHSGFDPEWNDIRHSYTTKTDFLMYFNQAFVQVPELVVYEDEITQLRYFAEKVLGKYAIGFNRDKGDNWWQIMFARNNFTVPGPWLEYVAKDAGWVFPYDTICYFQNPDSPSIPDEEFLPRRFDPECLRHWREHAH